MKRSIVGVSLVVGVICFNVSLFAAPPGLEKKDKTPQGFTKGEKTGWKGEVPPGWDKKTDEEKAKWNDDVKKGKEEVTKAAEAKGLTKEEAEAAADEVEKAARKGVDPEAGATAVKEDLESGKKGKELSDSVAEKTEKKLKKDKDKNSEEKSSAKGMGKKKGKGKKK